MDDCQAGSALVVSPMTYYRRTSIPGLVTSLGGKSPFSPISIQAIALRSRDTPFLVPALGIFSFFPECGLQVSGKGSDKSITQVTLPQVTELALCSWAPGYLMTTRVLHPLCYTRIQALSPPWMQLSMFCNLLVTSLLPSTTQLTVTWLCFVTEVKYCPTSSTLPNLQFVQDEATMWFL